MSQYNQVIFSYATFGPSGGYTPAATYTFFTAGYAPAKQGRSVGSDIVHNRNGIFKYLYDNGPNMNSWSPFELAMHDSFTAILGSATVQYNNLMDLWNHVGPLSAQFPEGVYNVHWAAQPLEKRFAVFPDALGDKIEFYALVQFEEA